MPQTILRNSPELWSRVLPAPDPHGHKYDRGHCLVVSGPALATGASRLAATAALNAGTGLVTLAGEREALLVQAAHVTAIMLKETPTPDALAALLSRGRVSAAVCGPAAGLGEEVLARLEVLLRSGLPLVLDADALTLLSGRLDRLSGAPQAPRVLTPHGGEFARLFGRAPAAEDRVDRCNGAADAARIAKSVIVLKGRHTVIAAPDGRAAVDETGGPELATAGSGDVLAGLVGAHLAQGMPAFEAACASVWLHGRCGALFGAGLTADRLVTLVRPAVAFL
jgi:hydroxyethylthiazole kinase-like uncharacterized protein yjeF